MTAKQKLFEINALTEHASTDPTPLVTLMKIAAVATAPETPKREFETPIMRMVRVETDAPAALDQLAAKLAAFP